MTLLWPRGSAVLSCRQEVRERRGSSSQNAQVARWNPTTLGGTASARHASILFWSAFGRTTSARPAPTKECLHNRIWKSEEESLVSEYFMGFQYAMSCRSKTCLRHSPKLEDWEAGSWRITECEGFLRVRLR